MNKSLLTILVLVIASVSGCGPKAPTTVPAAGTVLMDGKALEGAGVTFKSESGGVVALGTTDASGKFKIKTIIGENSYDGALVGAHKVTVAKSKNDGQQDTQQYADSKEMAVKMAGSMTSSVKTTFIVPKRYNSPETSGLTVDIPAGGSETLEIKVTSK